MILSCLFLLLISATTPPPTPHAVAYATHRVCVSTGDCLAAAHGLWCRSGQLCLRGLCHTLQGHPCRVGDFCLEREQRCVPFKQCATSADCDDGLFCNGLEQCVASRCQNNHSSPCPENSLCSEQNRSCDTPSTTTTTPQQSQQQKTIGTATATPTVAPTAAPTNGGTLDITQLWTILFIAGCVLVGIGLVFYIMTGAARPAIPASVVVITTADENGDTNDSRDLLSASAYQQTLHYT